MTYNYYFETACGCSMVVYGMPGDPPETYDLPLRPTTDIVFVGKEEVTALSPTPKIRRFRRESICGASVHYLEEV